MKTTSSLGPSEGLDFLFEQSHVRAIVRQITSRSPARPVLKSLTHHRLVVLIIVVTKGVNSPLGLHLATLSRLNRCFALIIDKSGVMSLLRHLCEITTLAKAHRNLTVVALHVLMKWFRLLLSLTIYSFEHFLITIINRVYVVTASVLDGQDLLEICNAGRLSKLFLITDLAKVCCTSFTRLLSHHGWISSGGWRRLTDEVLMVLRVPRFFRRECNANVWMVPTFWLDRMAASQNRQVILPGPYLVQVCTMCFIMIILVSTREQFLVRVRDASLWCLV